MPTNATSSKDEKARINMRLDRSLMRRVDAWSKSTDVSRSAGVSELLRIGLDSDTAGLESTLVMQQQLRKEIASLRSLVAEGVTAADTAAALLVVQMANAGTIKADQMIGTFISAREMARAKLKAAKKSAR